MDTLEPHPQSILQLKSILEASCSFSFQFNESPNIITKEQSLVVKDIERAINEDEGIVAKIMEGIGEIFSNEIYLKKALLPSVLKKDGVTFVIEQESLVRLLLRVNELQNAVFKLLMEELIRVCSDTEECSELRLLLNPLKYLPNINDAQYFSQKLLDILEICTPELQLEMLDVIPDIIPDSCYNLVAEQLLTILNEENSPWDAIIGCFGAFDFDDDVKKNIYGKLMNLIVPVHPQCLPATIKLLFNTHKGKIPLEIFLRIRDIIDSEMEKAGLHPLKSDIVNALRSVSNKEYFIQSCLDMLNSIKSPQDHKTFDLFILLILRDDTKYKEIIRKKVETGYFISMLVTNLVHNSHYNNALTCHDSSNVLIKLAGYLLRFVSTRVENFTMSLFEALISANHNKEHVRVLAKETIECIIRTCNNSDMKCVHQALRIFYNLVEKHPKKFSDNLNKLLGLLKKMDDFDLHAASMAYKTICHIPYILDPENPQSEALGNEINIMVRKQLMSSKRLKKSKGIMGAIMLLQRDIFADDTSDGGSNDEEMCGPMPPERTLTVIESVIILTEGFPECTGMFYDELATIVQKNVVKANFSEWMMKKTRHLLEYYVCSHKDQMTLIDNSTYIPKYGAVTPGKSLCLKIGLMCAEPHKYVNSPLILLPPLFRLYRILISKKFVDPMDSEDYRALLSCSFMLPSLENLEDLSSNQLKQTVDILFHTINYLNEVVDATISMPIHEELFLDRFELVIKLEGIFNGILFRITEHTFPTVYFYDCLNNKQMHEMKKKCTTRKGKKRKITHDDTTASTSVLSMNELNTTSTSMITSKKHGVQSLPSKYLIDHNIHFREISLYSLFNMIQYSTVVNRDEPSMNIHIEYSLLVFILRDVVKGLKGVSQKQRELPSLNSISTPEQVLKNVLEDLPKAVVSFRELVKEMDSLDISNDNVETYCELIMCFSYFLELFHLILNSPVEKSNELIHKVHQALDVGYERSDSPAETRKKLLKTFLDDLKISVVLSHGVLIYQMIEKIMEYEQSSNKSLKITLCEKIVNKQWSLPKCIPYSEKQFNQDTKFILEKYFKELKVEELHELLSKVAVEYVDLKKKSDHLPSLPIISYSNFHILFVSLCTALHENVEREVQFFQLRHSNMEHLKLWKNTTSFMFLLMGIARNVLNRHNILLCTFLKKSIPILKIFIAHALPIFDVMFSSKTEAVVEILKSMQASTRFIHHLCCQSKMFKNFSVISHIPSFRLVLEQLIYKVKALLVSHKCEEAFFLGNLKNKDIHGNTQTSEIMDEDTTQENEQGEDDETVQSDDDSDVNLEDDDRSESLTF
ncbi:Fanconi anemia group D2 protein [Coccinella septempunctata]|uniref:Fanconi anemia group D2 protein n=1 Tax=Coccinella septempunctata TaxID=41139 RepID=UPI001D091FD4|nr:Fanconi anemia group D2 protein [Coccinella septempunctata]